MKEDKKKREEKKEKQVRPEKERGSSFLPIERCDICGEPMIEIRCELICFNCGYRRDCTDT